MANKGDYHANLALFRPATQSSTDDGMVANLSVDGSSSSRSITNYNDVQPWWKVCLAIPIWVSQVEVISTPNRE